LFNSLNSIAALVEDDPKAGETAILSLARMFRYVLEGSRSTLVRLGDELDFVQNYLAMEALRFGKRLTFSLAIDAALHDTPVPPLFLQPLVENAVRHGMQARSNGRVEVSAERTNGVLILTVDDDGPGPEASSHRGAGTSHETLRARLTLLFGERASLSTGVSPLGGFRAEVRVPWGQP
jgi:LytS/YehU family sensor histidine kinase